MSAAEPTPTAEATGPPDDHAWIHIVPVPILLGVFAALLVLTGLTVAVTYVDLGMWNLWVALGIATVKASLVALYFMHLRYDKPFNAVILVSALVFLALFVTLAMMDSLEYQPDIREWEARQERISGSPY